MTLVVFGLGLVRGADGGMRASKPEFRKEVVAVIEGGPHGEAPAQGEWSLLARSRQSRLPGHQGAR